MGGSEGGQQIRTYKYQRMQMKRSMRGAQHDCGWRWRVRRALVSCPPTSPFRVAVSDPVFSAQCSLGYQNTIALKTAGVSARSKFDRTVENISSFSTPRFVLSGSLFPTGYDPNSLSMPHAPERPLE